MTGKVYILIFSAIIFLSAVASAQQRPKLVQDGQLEAKCRWIKCQGTATFIDSLSVVPGSLTLSTPDATTLDTAKYTYDYNTGLLNIKKEICADSLKICYQTLPFSFHRVYQHKSLAAYDSGAFFDDVRFRNGRQQGVPKEELFATPNLYKSGSISRGVTFGNRQDVFVNADLNLQLEGALTDDLNIRAAITDQNIPLQPEGNTQQLQDFDNVLIELYNDRFNLQAGDVLLQSQNDNTNVRDTAISNISSHFLKYRRNVQGGQLRSSYRVGENGRAQTSVGAALSKGKFASVTLAVQEGVQGPYLLQTPGANQRGIDNSGVGNAFFILANSEKVYLDGRLLQRGFNRDYVIDYNLGEITFTPNVLVTRYSRINVDFEYADRTFSRSVLNASHTQTHGKVTFHMGFYREKDNPNQPLAFDLDDEDKQVLSEIGDDISAAYVLAADSVIATKPEQHENVQLAGVPEKGTLPEIFYVKKDTLTEGVRYTIFEYTTKTTGVYRVSFSKVGLGNGNYEISNSTVNGRVYRWVAPMNGKPQGSYAPLKLIGTPKSKQMLSLGTEIAISNKDKVFAEVAFSNQDNNLFSEKDAEDNKGHALRVGYKSAPRNLKFWEGYQWSQQVDYEYREKHFSIIDPYRSIEFERDWSNTLPGNLMEAENAVTDDHILNFNTRLQKNSNNQIIYHFSGRNRGRALQGFQNTLSVAQQLGKLQINANGFLLNTRQYNFQSDWKRLNVDTYWRTKSVMPGYRFSIDRHAVKNVGSDSVRYAAMNFEEHQFYLQSSDSLSGSFRVDYSFRKDRAPYEGLLVNADQSHTVNARYNAHVHKNHRLGFLLTYRNLQNLNDSLNNIESPKGDNHEESLLGKITWSGSFLKNAIRSELDYAIGNGRELKREFIYVKVPTGEGPYTWRDDNGNGVEEIDEFYEARYPDERNYARIYISSGEYILAYTNTFNYRLTVQPPSPWHKATGIKKMMGMFSANASWSIDKKTDNPALGKRLNPFAKISEAHLLYNKQVIQSTVFFNRRNPKFGADYSIRESRRKQLLNVGFDERELTTHQLTFRYNIQKIWQFQWKLEKEESISIFQSDASSQGKNRSYWVDAYSLSPEVAWQPTLNFRLSGKYRYNPKSDDSQHLSGSPENYEASDAVLQVIGLETRWNKMIQNSLNASIDFVHIQYDGDENAPVAYEMLEALRPGKNLRWTLNWQQKIIDGLQMSVNYFGRKSPGQAVIHTGSVQVRALF